MKPGIRTTEFWVSILQQVIAIVALFHPDLSETIKMVALGAAGVGGATFTGARAYVKAAATEPQPTPVVFPPLPAPPPGPGRI